MHIRRHPMVAFRHFGSNRQIMLAELELVAQTEPACRATSARNQRVLVSNRNVTFEPIQRLQAAPLIRG